jgi:hypothetical protein
MPQTVLEAQLLEAQVLQAKVLQAEPQPLLEVEYLLQVVEVQVVLVNLFQPLQGRLELVLEALQ